MGGNQDVVGFDYCLGGFGRVTEEEGYAKDFKVGIGLKDGLIFFHSNWGLGRGKIC